MLSIHIPHRLEEKEEKVEFSKLDEMVESVPRIDRLVIGIDLDGMEMYVNGRYVMRIGWVGVVLKREMQDRW